MLNAGADPTRAAPRREGDVSESARPIDLREDESHGLYERGCELSDESLPDQASVMFLASLRADPDNEDAVRGLFAAALALQTMARLDEAEPLYHELLTFRPKHSGTYFNLGVLKVAAGEADAAILHYNRVLELRGENGPALSNLANLMLSQDRFGKAEDLARRAIEADPALPMAHYVLGNVHFRQGDFARALEWYDRALAAEDAVTDEDDALGGPSFVLLTDKRQESLSRLGRIAPAAPAAGNNPKASAACTVGDRLFREGRIDDAIAAFLQALALEPERVDILCNLAVALQHQREREASTALAKRIIRLDPSYVRAYHCIAVDCQSRGADKDALLVLNHALGLEPKNVTTLRLIGKFLEAMTLKREAVNAYQLLLQHAPGDAHAQARLVHLLLQLCDWSKSGWFGHQVIERTRAEIEQGVEVTTDIFALHTLPVSAEFMFAAAHNKARFIGERMAPVKVRHAFVHPPRESRRLRVGYVLNSARIGSLPLTLKAIIEQHDPVAVESFGYSLQPNSESHFETGFRAAFDHFADIPLHAPEAGARQIFADGIDVLMDVTGHTADNGLEVMALEPAPAQAHFLNYSVTTGGHFIHYLVTHPTFIPPELKPHCSEKLVYLPETFIPGLRPEVVNVEYTRADFGLPDDGVVFCNFNQSFKFEPEIFAAWTHVLAAVPRSVLWFVATNPAVKENLRREAELRGIDPARLVFADELAHGRHCARIALADLAFDCLHHGGGVTTIDALWMGVPVLSVKGETPAARNGAMLLEAAGLPETVCGSLAAYEALAIELAGDPETRAALRERLLANRATSPLFDIERYTRHLEVAYRLMWERHVTGLGPGDLEVPALPPRA